MANLFGGGGREAILSAVAEVCTRGETVSFKLREGGAGYLGLASPIEAETDRVGVVILLTEEPQSDDRLMDFQGEIAEPIDEAMNCLDELLEQTGGRRSEHHRSLVERGISALERARKWNDELHATVTGGGRRAAEGASLDPARSVRQVAQRISEDFASVGAELQLLAPTQMRSAAGDADMIETALAKLIRHRLSDAREGDVICLSAREVGEGDDLGVLFSVVDQPEGVLEGESVDSDAEPRAVRSTVSALDGLICTVEDHVAGRVTSIRLPLAPGP
ncbi:MAG: hypothetical protein JRH19_24530 [Deltaproteobacteria bacterium]|nr:hypothetical protein [Deltaproteobacteria bacterium]